ncbi:type IX secretion system anionic LPS delivery protein PorZ [Carboxylicivirga caseinilyticus]|uniref:type IX secretion system anionic LPS delivery protein PorZ n=1 Tax=Carboxylicivirga caseinilyticus TaxID=3417572 RepID=UPI003F671F8F
MRKIIITYFFIFIVTNIKAQSWTNHQPMIEANSITTDYEKIYVGTKFGMFSYDLNTEQIQTYNKGLPLSDSEISIVKYSANNDLIFIGYNNANIDIISNNNITNINDILTSNIQGEKIIYNVEFLDQFAYVSTNIGIVKINVERLEVAETYPLSNNNNIIKVFDVAFLNNYIYAATSNGIYCANMDESNLINGDKWKLILPTSSSNNYFNNIECVNDDFVITNEYSSVYSDKSFTISSTLEINSFKHDFNYISNILFTDHLYIFSDLGIATYNENYALDNLKNSYLGVNISSNNISPTSLIRHNQINYIADSKHGLIIDDQTDYKVHLNRPINENASKLTFNNELQVVTGSFEGNTLNPPIVHKYITSTWESINYSKILNQSFYNIIKGNESNEKSYYATWGWGIIETSNSDTILFNNKNSPLTKYQNYRIWTTGISTDNYGNLWIANSMADQPILIKSIDNNWFLADYPGIINTSTSGSNEFITDLFIDSNQIVWVVISHNGLFVVNTNSTPTDFSDDKYRGPKSLSADKNTRNAGQLKIWDESLNVITNNVYCITEDKNGYIWLGTDNGVVVYYRPWAIFTDDYPIASRIKIPRNDGSNLADYLLENENITCITVDGANRKWIGTQNSGLFLVSDDGITSYETFNIDNSPLPSNYINDVAIDPNSGEVFIATSKGIVSYKGKATEGHEDLNTIYAYPNPVREDFSGEITITGLVKDSNVKITTASGKLVFETRSLGGKAYWNGRNLSGEKVKSGVYIAYISSEDGSEVQTTKILIVR